MEILCHLILLLQRHAWSFWIDKTKTKNGWRKAVSRLMCHWSRHMIVFKYHAATWMGPSLQKRWTKKIPRDMGGPETLGRRKGGQLRVWISKTRGHNAFKGSMIAHLSVYLHAQIYAARIRVSGFPCRIAIVVLLLHNEGLEYSRTKNFSV